jgi:hypothetical protein
MHGVYSKVLVLILFFVSASCVTAGSLVEEQLSTLEEINVVVVVPRFEPIPGVAPDALQDISVARVAAILKKNGLQIANSSGQTFLVTVKLTRQGTGQRTLGLLILCELRESAVLRREWAHNDKQAMEVTSWRESRLILSSDERVLDDLMEAIDLETTEFVQKILQAREMRKEQIKKGGQ